MKTRSKFPTPLLLLVALPVFQACGSANAWDGTITDSAGVSVVHNTATPIWGSGDEWTVTEELRIGTVAGEPEYQFGQILPVASLDVDQDGNIYVMDGQAREARVYGPDGTYIRTLGGPGSGPGEFSAQAFFLFTDPEGRVVVPDLGNQRVSLFAPDGTPAGSFPIRLQAGIPALWDVDASGRIVAQLRGLNVEGMAALEEGDPIVVYDTTGTVVDTVALIPKGQTLEGTSEEQFSMVMFSPEPVWALDDAGSIYYALNDQYRILVNDPEGNLTRIITRDVERKPVEESDRNAILRLMREQMETLGAPPAQVEQILQGIGFADFYPVFARVLLGPGETLWVQRIRSARDMAGDAEEETEFDFQDVGSPEWEVFDVEGRYLGVATLPNRFSPITVVGDLFYGVWSDELDVQYVLRMRVNRPSD